jgi:hypothetical protein
MPIKFLRYIVEETSKGRFLYLLIALLILLGVGPFISERIGLRIVTDVFMTFILLAAIYAVSGSKHQTVTTLVLGVPLLATICLNLLYRNDWLMAAKNVFTILFFGYIIVNLLKFIFKAPRVSRNVIYASIIVYLMLGVTWGSVFYLIYQFDPTSFDLSVVQIEKTEHVFMYFSFVSLTTLGYGDISPITSHAYSLAVLEAIIGQLYLTVLVARLVGLHISHSTDTGTKKK